MFKKFFCVMSVLGSIAVANASQPKEGPVAEGEQTTTAQQQTNTTGEEEQSHTEGGEKH